MLDYVLPALSQMEAALLWVPDAPQPFPRDGLEVVLRVLDWTAIQKTMDGLSEAEQARWDQCFTERADDIRHLAAGPTVGTYAATELLEWVVQESLRAPLAVSALYVSGDPEFLWDPTGDVVVDVDG